MNVTDIAAWGRFGDHLYHKNIRGFKGSTDVNDAIVSTLRERPENFLYFNNGITLLCSQLDKQPYGGSSRASGVFECKGASVVNGAQTAGTIINMNNPPESARVMVRLISLEKCPLDFASDVTRATNTQNRIEKRDFAALDKEQSRPKSEMWLSLGKEYVFRTGDIPPKPEDGCTLDEATVALACSNPDITYCMTAKREVSKLYDDISQPPYIVLFNASVTATKLWQSVEIMRKVEESLKQEQSDKEGKDRLISVHGNRFILYLMFRTFGTKVLDQDSGDMSNTLKSIPGTTRLILSKVIENAVSLYPNAYPSNLFKNITKCKALADVVTQELDMQSRASGQS